MLEKADDYFMLQNAEEIARLLHKYLKDELTPQEKVTLDNWVSQSAHLRRLFERISSEDSLNREIKEYYDLLPQIEAIYRRHASDRANTIAMFSSKKTPRYRWVAAASIAVLIAVASYLFFTQRETKSVARTPTPAITDTSIIPAARNRAILTLANGSQVILDSINNGVVAQQMNTTIQKKDGQLEYNITSTTPSTLAYNIVTTPRGGKYQIVLPDGSKVWLNAASSLRFPAAFTENERRVELSGEAYFEITHLPLPANGGGGKKPFIVSVNNQTEVKVLGTHFNVNAYSDDSQRTTLLEGSVEITPLGSNQGEILRPGQQAILPIGSHQIKVVTKANPGTSTAWVKGKFSFEQSSIESMMRELSRWYDVQIKYEGKVPAASTLTGVVDRTIPLSELLSTLNEMGEAQFKLEGRTIKVIP